MSPASGILKDEDVFYLHIGLQYGSPFRPTFLLMLPEGPSDPEGGLHPEYALLREAGSYLSAVRLASMLHQGYTWLVQVYELESTMRPVAKMLPAVVSARRGEQEVHQLWPEPPRIRYGGYRRAAGPRGPRAKAAPRAPAALGDDDSSGDDSGDDAAVGGGGEGGVVGEAAVAEAEEAVGGEESEELADDVAAEQRVLARAADLGALLGEMESTFADGGGADREPLERPAGDAAGSESQPPAAVVAASSGGQLLFLIIFVKSISAMGFSK